jgi:hypothetical protein
LKRLQDELERSKRDAERLKEIERQRELERQQILDAPDGKDASPKADEPRQPPG